MPTYLAMPVLTAALFGGAVLPPLVMMARHAPAAAAALALLWLVLLVALLWDGQAEGLALVAALATLLLHAPVAGAIVTRAGWSDAAPVRVAVIESVMLLVAAVNQVRRRRGRQARPRREPLPDDDRHQ